jgi:tRNA1Val (adenine37-N6)-methyltransferase
MIFRFKQFFVDQTGCAMKINTDGVLLGAIAGTGQPATILDIGTGTGVIALMLAQRFTTAKVDAVEIDEVAAHTAERNFAASPFSGQLAVYATSFESYFAQFPERKYDLIVSNPPFYIDSLKSPGAKKTLAKHTDRDFFERLIKTISMHISPRGKGWLILPLETSDIVMSLASKLALFPQNMVRVSSYPYSGPHRIVLFFGFKEVSAQISNLAIYEAKGLYSNEYQKLLQSYFLAF